MDLSKLKDVDPLKRLVEKQNETEESSPMDPPGAYEKKVADNLNTEDWPELLQRFVNEHKVAVKHVNNFEAALVQFQNGGYAMTTEINHAFGTFFRFFDEKIMDHNQREEKQLFPLLNQRLIESGEHSKGPVVQTAIDVMEDDHIKFIQLGALAFNLFGLAARIPDRTSSVFVYETACHNSRELIEMLRLHIFREDHTLFPLAVKLFSPEDWSSIKI